MVYTVPYAAPPHDKHWALVWQVGSSANIPVYRQCEAVREGGHLINRGPITHFAKDAKYTQGHSLGLVSYENRQEIEKIAAGEPVVSDGQSWLKSVIDKCVKGHIFDATTASSVIQKVGH